MDESVLESVVFGIGYNMTPTEEELQKKNQWQQQQQRHPGVMSGTMKPFQMRTHHRNGDSAAVQGQGGGDDDDDIGGRRQRGSSKLRRAFSLNSYRNPFRAQPKTASMDANAEGSASGTALPAADGHEAKRRVSWRKFLLKIAAQLGGSNLMVNGAVWV